MLHGLTQPFIVSLLETVLYERHWQWIALREVLVSFHLYLKGILYARTKASNLKAP